ncbi:MAG: hypothetical protein HC860_10165 [Alkalinema sp. RU_4_3]|nr:hypothetical protein [Alkalinema sp. RU_4_3]
MFDFFAAAANPFQTSPSNASPFSHDAGLPASTFPPAAAASAAPLATGNPMPPANNKVDLGSNSPIVTSEVPAPTPPIVIIVTNETPSDVGTPDPDIFFF